MKDVFGAHYPLSDGELATLFKHAIVVPDTSMLLNLYEYSLEARDEVLDILRLVRDRLWLPYWVGFEFFRNRPAVITRQARAYGDLLEQLSEEGWQRVIGGFSKLDYGTPAALDEEVRAALTVLRQSVATARDRHIPVEKAADPNDYVLQQITELVGDRVGEPYDEQNLKRLRTLAGQRFERQQPPGYMDEARKSGDYRYGDFFIWDEVLTHAKQERSNVQREGGAEIIPAVALITDDGKEDWWESADQDKVSPAARWELIDEMWRRASARLLLFNTEGFLEQARKSLGSKVADETIREVRAVRNNPQPIALRAALTKFGFPAAIQQSPLTSTIFGETPWANNFTLRQSPLAAIADQIAAMKLFPEMESQLYLPAIKSREDAETNVNNADPGDEEDEAGDDEEDS